MIELQIATPKQIPLIKVILLKFSSTQPAPLILTLGTCHVIAAFIWDLGDPGRTLRTVHNFTLSFSPLKILSIVSFLACGTLMDRKSTLETDDCAASVTCAR